MADSFRGFENFIKVKIVVKNRKPLSETKEHNFKKEYLNFSCVSVLLRTFNINSNIL